MSILERKGLSQNERFKYALGLSIITSVLVGILVGLLRTFYDSAFWVLIVGYCIAYVIRKYGRGVQTRFAILGLLTTILGLYLSDIVFSYGVMGLLNLENYLLVIQFMIYDDSTRLLWIVTRSISLFIAYSYSRVV